MSWEKQKPESMPPELRKKKYDEGWAAYCEGVRFNRASNFFWRKGWLQARDAGARRVAS